MKGEASRSISNNASPRVVRGGESSRGGGRIGNGGVRRIRDLHPPLESCRSVYCYEVCLPY